MIDNIDKIVDMMKETDSAAAIQEDLCNKIVDEYSSSLNNLMLDMYRDCIKDENTSTRILEKYYLELANLLYFTISKQEHLGIYVSLTKTSRDKAYSKAYLKYREKDTQTGRNKITTGELSSLATLDSEYEQVVNNIYDTAYRIIKGRVQQGQEMMNCIRRILSTRTTEMSLTNMPQAMFDEVYETKNKEEE